MRIYQSKLGFVFTEEVSEVANDLDVETKTTGGCAMLLGLKRKEPPASGWFDHSSPACFLKPVGFHASL